MEILSIRSALPIKQVAGKRRAKYEYDQVHQLQQHRKHHQQQQHPVTAPRCLPNHQSCQIKLQQLRRPRQRRRRPRLRQQQQSTVAPNSDSRSNLNLIALLAIGTAISLLLQLVSQPGVEGAERMVRLCIASVDPAKLSSQCVMCNRREFPLTVIDCTGITKVNDLIANPLSVQEATCLIYNCRRVSDITTTTTIRREFDFCYL